MSPVTPSSETLLGFFAYSIRTIFISELLIFSNVLHRFTVTNMAQLAKRKLCIFFKLIWLRKQWEMCKLVMQRNRM
uniref:Uncharacterized protein n=1 Tax=Geobacillus sp. (strain WCH70) TaxID=471223 RepID=C5D7R0_GEOSW